MPQRALAPNRPVALAPLAVASGSAAASRSEPRPQLKTTKEWVVPPRPKPGRKPQAEQDSSRKQLSRQSQRAHRDRRQEYVGELEERIRALEANEGEKLVFYQGQAIKAKEAAVALRLENDNLKALVEELRNELEQERGSYGASAGKGKSTRVSPTGSEDTRPLKRPRRLLNDGPFDYLDSPPSPQTSSVAISPPQSLHQLQTCGFCSSEGDCFCANISYEQQQQALHQPELTIPQIKLEDDIDMPMYQPAVPLRFRKALGSKAPSVWAIDPPPSSSTSAEAKPALCNGDPSNCPACSDDPFGKAFCESLSQSVCSTSPCSGCPSHAANISRKRIPTPPPEVDLDAAAEARLFESLTDLPCCGDPALCGSLTCGPKEDGTAGSLETLPKSVPLGIRSAETLPCNEAWKTLKNHPNIAFADLQMLADVVAKRTRCDGPIPTSSTVSSSAAPSTTSTAPTSLSDGEPGEAGAPRVELVPQQALMCVADAGQRKRLTVERGAVNEALEILDRAVGRGGPLKR